ncbi:hypothetical protein [Lysinibacillus xylanilyticus]|uniref:hypothetical protein n=1 Tax=Lysinibacillus xylanilyticus TaxID=582475 RepID=UPI0036D97969
MTSFGRSNIFGANNENNGANGNRSLHISDNALRVVYCLKSMEDDFTYKSDKDLRVQVIKTIHWIMRNTSVNSSEVNSYLSELFNLLDMRNPQNGDDRIYRFVDNIIGPGGTDSVIAKLLSLIINTKWNNKIIQIALLSLIIGYDGSDEVYELLTEEDQQRIYDDIIKAPPYLEHVGDWRTTYLHLKEKLKELTGKENPDVIKMLNDNNWKG